MMCYVSNMVGRCRLCCEVANVLSGNYGVATCYYCVDMLILWLEVTERFGMRMLRWYVNTGLV